MSHELSKTRLYKIYQGMKQRCYNESDHNYSRYGGRGIKICDGWLKNNGLQNFIEWSLDNGYNDDLTIDRIDPNGNYEPSNCRWVTRSMNTSLVFDKDIINHQVKNEFIFTNNEHLIIELKKLMLDDKISKKEIADKMKIKPQGLTKLLNKKNFGFEDVQKILEAMGYEMEIKFIKKESRPNLKG